MDTIIRSELDSQITQSRYKGKPSCKGTKRAAASN